MEKHWLLRLRIVAAVWIMTAVCTVTAFAEGSLIPVGETVGIQIKMDGVLVAGVTDVETAEGPVSPAKDAGLRAGDVIVAVDAKAVHSAAELIAAVEALQGRTAAVTVRREGRTVSFDMTPALEEDGGMRLGLWLRDGVAGIGTVTYIDPCTGAFGALGHGVNDLETGVLLPVADGSVCRARVVDVKKGVSGTPGELAGSFDAGDTVGSIRRNTPCGIFGTITGSLGALRPAMPVGGPEDVEKGPATILACVTGGQAEEYDVEIGRTGGAAGSGRDLTVHVTDPDLLSRTGGIVQGMSGSPIIQNGKLVGAVTHVLVDDPTRGYGVFIDTMLAAAA